MWSTMMHYTTVIHMADIFFVVILSTCVRMISSVSFISTQLGESTPNIDIGDKMDMTEVGEKHTNTDETVSQNSELISNFKELFFYQTSLPGFPFGAIFNYGEYLQIVTPNKIYFSFPIFFKIVIYCILLINLEVYTCIGDVTNNLSFFFYDNSTRFDAILYITLLAGTYRLKMTAMCTITEMFMNNCGVGFYNKKKKLTNGFMAWISLNLNQKTLFVQCFYQKNRLDRFKKSISMSLVIAFNVIWHGPYIMYSLAGILIVIITLMQESIIKTFEIYENNKNASKSSLKDLKECFRVVKEGKFNFNIFFNLIMWILTHTTFDFFFIVIFTCQYSIIWNIWSFLSFYPSQISIEIIINIEHALL
ncbi:hypothetical protein A3Q56_04272 [Intoshia linei]|uniref:Uncharacterized protein n=1 Tax=Intoshia linei TaxID=1819745 RepID=A0A177B317_9BILA|nr:hypothetical protein A3Q56_04272 [Intoshia linei]